MIKTPERKRAYLQRIGALSGNENLSDKQIIEFFKEFKDEPGSPSSARVEIFMRACNKGSLYLPTLLYPTTT
jgi:hypothetical protein